MTTNDPFDLQRFVTAQDADGLYEQVVEELRRGRKTSHWMWFVFPQVAGLGRSVTSKRFAVSSIDEAQAYLAHPMLGPRLIECAHTVANVSDRTVQQILGSVDAQKLQSSMTLFMRAAPDERAFSRVLDAHFEGRPDLATDHLLSTPAEPDSAPGRRP